MALNPPVSVLMPVRSATPHLDAAVSSVLDQTIGDLELIMHVDVADAGSMAAAQAIAARDSRIVLLQGHGAGEADARNKLLMASRGAFVAWMEGDAISATRRLETQLEFLEAHADIDAVGTAVVLLDAAGSVIERMWFTADPEPLVASPDMCGATLVARGERARSAPPFREFFFPGAGDRDWMSRFCDRHRVATVTDALYSCRRDAARAREDFFGKSRQGALVGFAQRERRAGRPDPIDALEPGVRCQLLLDAAILSHSGLMPEDKLAALAFSRADQPPLISVLIPFEDHHETLHDALLSIAVQSFRNFEVVICDNASELELDAADINLANYRFPARIVRLKRRKPGSEVCQALVDAARGQFLIWQRPDATSRNDRLEVMLRYMLDNPDCKAAGSGVNTARGNLTDTAASISYRVQAVVDGRFEGAPHTFMLRRSALADILPFRASDWRPLDGGAHLARIQPQSAVHNFLGFMLQVFPDRPLLDVPKQRGQRIIGPSKAFTAKFRALVSSRVGAAVQSMAAGKAPLRDQRGPAIHARPIVVRLIASSGDVEVALDRLLPGSTRRWKNVEFVTEEGRRVDYHVFLECPRRPFHVVAPPNRIWFAIGEPPTTAHRPLHRGAGRGSVVLTCSEDVESLRAAEPRRYISTHCMLATWSVERTWDVLAYGAAPEKTKDLSWVTSSIPFISGHRYRLQFLERLRKSMPFDLFGRGFTPIDDKWDGIAPYRYSIAFENYRGPTYFSEKLMDCFVAETFPLYFGCSEIEKYFPAASLWQMDPEDPFVMDKIRDIVASDLWRDRLDAVREAKQLVLNKYNMFITMAELIGSDTARAERPREMVINPVYIDYSGA